MRKDPVLVEIGSRIQKARKDRKISQEDLAHRAGLHRTFMGLVERAERSVTVLSLLRISTALDIEPGELLNGLKVEPKPEKESPR